MPPVGGGAGEHGCTVQAQGHPPETVRRDQDVPLPPHSAPPSQVYSTPLQSSFYLTTPSSNLGSKKGIGNLNEPLLPFTKKKKKKKKKNKKQKLEHEQHPVPSLPEGALVEILSRVPYRSLCRFKCVSKPWLALCSAPDIRRRSPQTLSGFFYYQAPTKFPLRLNFRNLSGRGLPLVDPSFPFLRQSYSHVAVRQVCGGFLLCTCWTSMLGDGSYIVCNPATEEWTELPALDYPWHGPITFMGVDAAAPSRFVVFAPQPNICDPDDSREVAIYSSETGRWTHVQSGWSTAPLRNDGMFKQVFLNGTIYVPTIDNLIATVDMEGRVWREIQMPGYLPCDIGQSQGRLYAWRIDDSHVCQLYIWVLEDCVTGRWTLKHTVNVLELFGRHCREAGESYRMFAFHPDCNMIFLTDEKKMTVSYDMDNQKVNVICTKGMNGVPYTPCFAELPSARH